MDSFISFLIIYGPSPALILLILAAVIVGLIWLGVTRPRRRRRRIGRGIYVVGSHTNRYTRKGYRNSSVANVRPPASDEDAYDHVSPYKVGVRNPFTGRINVGSPDDFEPILPTIGSEYPPHRW